MTGRELFDRYEMIFKIAENCVNFLPVKIRKIWFIHLRKKDGRFAMLKRYVLIKTLAKRVGKNVAIFPDVYFENIEKLEIGSNVSIHQMCYIDAEGGIEIGDDVSVAHRSTILSSNHVYDDVDIPIKYQGMILKRTILESNLWIGAGVSIMAGVHIASGCVIGAGSVVTHNIESNSIAVGNPARVLKERTK